MAKPYIPPPPMTDKEYWSELEIVAKEVDEAAYFYNIMEGMNDLLLNDKGVQAVWQRDYEFWQAHRGSNQIALFMALWRLFDITSDAKSIHYILRLTSENLHIFSLSALRLRKQNNLRDSPQLVEGFMRQAWEPTSAADLRVLKERFKPHNKLFHDVYGPIRNRIYGHRLISDADAGSELFPKTNRAEIGAMIDFLQWLINALKHLFNNGTKPTFQNGPIFSNQRIRDMVKDIMGRLSSFEGIDEK
jgi:hypothetical protein